MFSKSAIVGSLFFLSAVNGAVIPAQRDIFDDATSLLGNAVSDSSSIYSVGTSYYSSGLSYASSAISEASSDVSTYLHGGQNTLLTGWVTVSNGVTLTEVSEIGGSVVTLAASGQGTPTTLGGQVFTVITAAPSPPPASGASPASTSSPTPTPTPTGTGSSSSTSNHSAGFKPGMSTFLTSLAGVAAWLVL